MHAGDLQKIRRVNVDPARTDDGPESAKWFREEHLTSAESPQISNGETGANTNPLAE